ncbi:MAG: zinc ABC transporter substrate-binding protein [Nitrososphaerota archaeon]|nr:zinc ABC transporter substrate-binding protein [Nitrososphaerota archaeon]
METSRPSTRRSVTIAGLVVVVLVVAVAAGILLTRGPSARSVSSSSPSGAGGSVVNIVAAENFWGSLASQLAGVHGNVTSIVSDPNTDPHQYEASLANARAVANAKIVIFNGMEYDTWAQKLVSASASPGQIVLDAQQIVGLPDTLATYAAVNPHLWYSPYYVNDTVHAMYSALVKVDPADASYFSSQYSSLNSSLYQDYMKAEQQMRAQYGGSATVSQHVLRQYSGNVSIAATESIVQFLANATGLNIVSPIGFMFAVAAGNDPSPVDLATFQQQLEGGNTSVRCLVYNEQTVTPLTQQMKAVAAQYGVPLAQVSETIQPPTLSFQTWMQGEVAGLQNCLDAGAPGS